MLSDKMADKYFNTQQVQGKHLRANNQLDLEVTGTFESFPAQSHWHPDFLVSFSTLNDSTIYGKRGLETNWGNNSFATYVLAGDQFDKDKLEAQFPAFIDKHMGNNGNPVMPSTYTNIFLQPLADIHLRSHLDSEIEANGNINNVYMMGVIGVFIMLIAGFNFVNLSTARATKRSKEVGLRKVAGAFKTQLIFQYLSESIMIAAFAIVLAIAFAWLSLGWLNDFTNKSLTLSLTTQWPLYAGLIAVALLVGVLAGIYPAFIISGFKPALIVKGDASKGKGTLRKVLVVAQFSISVMLIVATLITVQQLQFMNNRQLGYSKDQVVTLRYFGQELSNNYDAFYNELVKSASVRNMARSSRIPTGRLLDSSGAQIEQGDSLVATNVVIKFVRTDYEFFDTYEIPLVAGRNFSKEIKTDDSLAYVLNESAVAMIGWTPGEAVGKVFPVWWG
ncbi:MAG: FtsX-like permease family protein [Bacteroidia bacterium]|nr:FtsX-like permease family protein [Bacteroidia bacterium]